MELIYTLHVTKENNMLLIIILAVIGVVILVLKSGRVDGEDKAKFILTLFIAGGFMLLSYGWVIIITYGIYLLTKSYRVPKNSDEF